MVRAQKQKQERYALFNVIEGNPSLLDLLAVAISSTQKATFITALLESHPHAISSLAEGNQPHHLFDNIASWFGSEKNAATTFVGISAALKTRHRYIHENRFEKRHFITSIGMDWTSVEKISFFSKVQVISLPRLAQPYPPKYQWMVETDAIASQWRSHIQEGKQPDKRAPRYPLFHVNPLMLQKDVSADESLLVYDQATNKLEMLILRNFTNHSGLLNHMGDVIKRAVEYRKSIRVSATPNPLEQPIDLFQAC
jgi:hypothetical protein